MTEEDSSQRLAGNSRLKTGFGWAVIGLFIYATLVVVSAGEEFFVPVVLAFLLAMIFGPIRRVFDRIGFPSGLSSFLIVFAVLVGFLMVFSALALPVSEAIHNAPQIERQIQKKIQNLSSSMGELSRLNAKIDKMTESKSKHVKEVKVQGSSGVLASVGKLAPSVLAQFIFTFVLLLFLLASGDMFYEKLVHVMPTFKDKKRAMQIAYGIERKLSRYLLTITTINFGLGVAVGVTMWLWGMPSPLIFGVIAFVFNFVPYLGAFAGIAIAAAVALVSFDWIGWVPILAGNYLLLTAIEGQFITPYFVGRSLRLNTVVVFIAVSGWAFLWSAVGMIVAVPLLVAIMTFCENIDELHNFGDFLSERGAEKGELPSNNDTNADSSA